MLKTPIIESSQQTKRADADLVFAFQDGGRSKGPYRDLLNKLTKKGSFTASAKSFKHIPYGGVYDGAFRQKKDSSRAVGTQAEDVILVGLGKTANFTPGVFLKRTATAWRHIEGIDVKSIHIDLDSLLSHAGTSKNEVLWVRALCEGLVLPSYRFQKYRKSSQKEVRIKVNLFTKKASLRKMVQKEIHRATAVRETVNLCRDWSNEPSNFGTPVYFANEAKKWARKYGLKCKVLTERDAAREKMGLLLGVSQGSEREARVVVLEYVPKGVKNPKTVALVGKGVTFDSGGISIKPSLRMEEMKHDMTGAATMMGATLLASKLKVKNRVLTILGFTENMPSGKATQPGNVHRSRAGKTVEIINTDAEGRLVLADCLDYIQDRKPNLVIDAATLTGAVGVALGKHCCALMSNDDKVADHLLRLGLENHEKIWRLPDYDEYFEDLKSEIADLKNSVNNGYGGTIRAGMFLKQFVRKGVKWAHLDIAYTAWEMGHLPYFPKTGASGAHVRTLAQFLEEF